MEGEGKTEIIRESAGKRVAKIHIILLIFNTGR
jgi:hypothetical protein